MATQSSEEDSEDSLPRYGWRVHLDNTFSLKPQPCYLPRWSQIPRLLGLGWRFMKYATRERKNGRVPFIDPFSTNPCRQVYGVPLGGIGCGSIGRGWKGEFNRWQISPGMYNYTYVEANQFIVCVRKKGRTTYQAVLSPNRPNGVLCGRSLQGWNWGFNGCHATYHALYPRAWTIYHLPGQNIKLVCRQISPIFPNDYKDTSLPVCVFIWDIENNNDEEVEVSIMFTFQNSDGTPNEVSAGHFNESFTCKVGAHSSTDNHVHEKRNSKNIGSSSEVTGVLLHHKHPTQPYTFGIAAKSIHQPGKNVVTVTTKTAFDAQTPCRGVWEDLMDDGKLSPKTGPSEPCKQEQILCAAVAATTKIQAKGKAKLEFALCWDNPVIHFGSSKTKHYRFYTRFFGRHGNAGKALCRHALMHYPKWESKIDIWQKPILQDDSLPSWYKSALFNELYFVADGGTVWLDVADNSDDQKTSIPDFVKEYGRFAYLEGHEYRMYNTYDVHFYASFALTLLWPKLQLSLQYDIAQSVNEADNQVMLTMMNGRNCQRKVSGCVPHDVGDPAEEPWEKVNAYTIHDTAQWKDLNLKFVLQVYRDYVATKNIQFLKDMWPVTKKVMNKTMMYDTDGDGLIENSGFADQTYDAWPVTGPRSVHKHGHHCHSSPLAEVRIPRRAAARAHFLVINKGAGQFYLSFDTSAYCGGLWLASLRVMQEIAVVLEFPDEAKRYAKILSQGKKAYHSLLWNGTYYNYDSSTSKYSNSIMADQMAGQWYLKACDLAQTAPSDQVFPRENVVSALVTVYKNNVLKFQDGTMGAVNGMRPNGQVDTSSLQAEEVWTGVTYAVAAAMIQEGLVEEGFRTASGIYNTCFERLGMGFQTPEAIVASGNFRSLGYMRPLSIWAMQWALEKRNKPPVTPDAHDDAAAPIRDHSQCNGFCKVSNES